MTDYRLNPEGSAFSYTLAELFECITKIVAHPHETITEHDKARAMAIFITFSDYLANFTESDNNFGYYINECESTDFEAYVLGLLKKPPNFYNVNANELLK